MGIAAYNYLYIADAKNHKIIKLNEKGEYISEWNIDRGNTFPKELDITKGLDIAVDINENIYIYFRNQAAFIKIYNADGNEIGTFGGLGVNNGEFIPVESGGVAVDKEGEFIYVADSYRVQKFQKFFKKKEK
jgi:DNA-binding beta-propeller fold protein YncE